MKIRHTSRDSFRQYAKQMHRYGFMKVYLGYRERSHRWIDFVPLTLMIVSFIAAVVVGPWWLILAIVPFSLLEAIVVVATHRCSPYVAMLTFPAWITKNVAWSVGVSHGILSLVTHPKRRRRLASTRLAQ